MNKRNWYLLFLIPLSFSICTAQTTEKDTLKDTLKVYHSIERFAKKNKLTTMLYKAVFNLPDHTTRKDPVLKKADNFERFGGRIIRRIIIQPLDPFGFSVRDTSIIPRSFVQKAGNALHNRSSPFTIRNQLLFQKGDSLDPLKLKESERLIRQSEYARDVIMTVKPVKGTDSVDVYVREQDLWSIGIGIGIAGNKKTLLFKDKNFMGLSHKVESYWYYYSDTKKSIVEGVYTVPYLKNTYMTVTGHFNTNTDNQQNGILINRPFFSPLTKWAWGADYLFHGSVDSVLNSEQQPIGFALRYNDLDLWLGRSFQVSPSRSIESRSTRIITTARYLKRTYTETPLFDTAGLYRNSSFYLGGIGISNRTYYRDYYIYQYGIPEDVPAGRLAELLAGYEQSTVTGRLYAGVRTGFGQHFHRFGYISVMTGFGTFLRNGLSEQAVINSTIGYFSDLKEIGSWKLRQFAKLLWVQGVNRKSGEGLNINNENGINGFESSFITGTKKAVVTLQSQFYLPYNFIGFRFAPFVFCNFGLLSPANESLFAGRIYQGYGLGILIKNELLTVNTFQLSFGWYPFIPGAGRDLLQYNPVRTYDFTFRDFDIQKPLSIPFE